MVVFAYVLLFPGIACLACPYLPCMTLQGGVSVAKEVKYADKAQYLPWRPR